MKRSILLALLVTAAVLVALPATAEVAPAPEPLFETPSCAPANMSMAQPAPSASVADLQEGDVAVTSLASSDCNAGAWCRQSSECFCYDLLCACVNRQCLCIAEA